jgi:hypothetical protein
MSVIAFIFGNYLWLILLTCIMIASAYTTNKINDRTMFIINCLLPIIPTWPLIALYSKRVVFDGLLFDTVLTIVYTISILYFTDTFSHLRLHNYLGLLLILVGLIIFKIGV